jgi:hypothetical protein
MKELRPHEPCLNYNGFRPHALVVTVQVFTIHTVIVGNRLRHTSAPPCLLAHSLFLPVSHKLGQPETCLSQVQFAIANRPDSDVASYRVHYSKRLVISFRVSGEREIGIACKTESQRNEKNTQ